MGLYMISDDSYENHAIEIGNDDPLTNESHEYGFRI